MRTCCSSCFPGVLFMLRDVVVVVVRKSLCLKKVMRMFKVTTGMLCFLQTSQMNYWLKCKTPINHLWNLKVCHLLISLGTLFGHWNLTYFRRVNHDKFR